MNAVFAKILYELEKEHDVVLVTITSQAGSAPRGTGAHMLVGAHGHIMGTIGGGAIEQRSVEFALHVLEEKRSALKEFRLYQNDESDIGMVCGGDVTVWFQYIPHDAEVWKRLAGEFTAQAAGWQRGWFIQRLDGSAPSLFNFQGSCLVGDDIPFKRDLLSEGLVCTEQYLSIPISVGDRAIIFGGGHCALALAPILKSVGFRVTVVDDRPEFAASDRFPTAEQVICGDFSKISEYLTLNEDDYIVVMTSGHSYDFEVQAQALKCKPAYIGVIGSRQKIAAVNEKLRQTGLSEEAIHQVHTPIGTAIKAVTPEEIAVSIAGEMIMVRATHREAASARTHSCPMQ